MDYTELKTLVRKYVHQYYTLNSSSISDAEFDVLYDKLEVVERTQGWADIDSPTRKVGDTATTKKLRHPHPLYSLKKTYDLLEIESDFDVNTPKIDGSCIDIIYHHGKLAAAITRGDGIDGEDVTHLVPGIRDVPTNLVVNISEIAIIGEAITFNEVTNFRNYASGALGLKELKEFRSRNIGFIAHDWLNYPLNYKERMALLSEYGFKTVLDEEYCKAFPQDGRVYRINSFAKSQKLGYTSKYPRFAVALKEKNKTLEATTLRDVVWVVGRTGTVNPVGIIDPVIIEDATISRVTLHNLDFILSNNLGLGDIVIIERAGGIIPQLVKVLKHSDNNLKINKQHAERYLSMELDKQGPKLITKNNIVSLEKTLAHFTKTMKIKGLGPQSLLKMGFSHISDLYDPKLDWSVLGANGLKVKQEIESSKSKPFEIVLAALGIPLVGETASKKIVKHIHSFSDLRKIEYTDIDGVGPRIKQNILSWLDTNEDWVSTLPLQLQNDSSIDSILSDRKEICITGKLDMTRNALAAILTNFGYIVKDNVTKSCYALITGGEESTKSEKARQYNVKIVNYWEHKNTIIEGIV